MPVQFGISKGSLCKVQMFTISRGRDRPLPESLHEVERFIADNPNHPYRVAESLKMLLKYGSSATTGLRPDP